MAINLPNNPKGLDYEDQIAAMLLASGYYLETRLTLQKDIQVLELDAIATPIDDYTNRKVVEVKSGDWGIPDIFKLYGQTMYTGHDGAWLIHKDTSRPEKKATIRAMLPKTHVEELHIDCRNAASMEKSDNIPAALEMDSKLRSVVYKVACYSRHGDREAQTSFKDWVKNHRTKDPIVSEANAYCAQVDDSLFKESPIQRVDALYDAYKQMPHPTAKLKRYLASSQKSLEEIRHLVNDTSELPHVQYIMALEHKARIAIIKNAYDAVLAKRSSLDSPASGTVKNWDAIYQNYLPPAFRRGMAKLESTRDAQRVAFFLQMFIDVFGGFYSPNHKGDVDNISAATGVSPSDIADVLSILDAFFPDVGWVYKPGTDFHFVKGVPGYIRGAGCFARYFLYGRDWMESYPAGPFWMGQIRQWHGALHDLLEPRLKAA